MKITTDTNVLLRAVIGDDSVQAGLARAAISDAKMIVIPIAALCEFVWVARRIYKLERHAIADAIDVLTAPTKVAVDENALMAGLTMLRAGGDFADGVIAFEGRRSGGETFVTFDRKAARRVNAAGYPSRYLPTEH
uniref:PIN domain-containing protein n=1 Tax=Nostoc flagelliforme str. Sunitezuoqi TaxID=676037 RepID=E7DPW5_9NOSO|nr:hypothetical protein Nfla_5002 [Nostoc flagelliforme str. Sunitezuoqi]